MYMYVYVYVHNVYVRTIILSVHVATTATWLRNLFNSSYKYISKHIEICMRKKQIFETTIIRKN